MRAAFAVEDRLFRALAVIRDRDYVVPEDIKDLAHAALDHRITIRPELWLQNASSHGVVASVLQEVPVPSAHTADTTGADADAPTGSEGHGRRSSATAAR